MKPAYDEFVIADDITLHYVQWGTQGPVIICTHDLTANAFCFQALAAELASDYRVIAYDIRGRGDSDKLEEDYSIAIYAADLAALIDELQLERPIVLGHGLGALVSLHYAAHHPTSLHKLVLFDGGAPLPWHRFAEMPDWLKTSISHLDVPVASLKDYIDRFRADFFMGSHWNDYIDSYVKHDVLINDDGSTSGKIYPAALVEEANRLQEARPEEQWAHVMVPTLLVRAGEDLGSDNPPFLSEDDAKMVQQGIRDCHYVNFPTLNHYTLIFGIERGPGQAVRAFIGED